MPNKKIKKINYDFKQTNPSLILGLIIISFGTYIINWIYHKNKELLLIVPHAPEAIRGVLLMTIFPFLWFFITFTIKNLILKPNNKIIIYIENFGWIIILILIIKYLFDFCFIFGEITDTNGHLWFLTISTPIIAISIGIILNIHILYLFLIILIIIIPSMQSELNILYKRITIENEKSTFYN